MMIVLVLLIPVVTVARCAVLTGRIDKKVACELSPRKYRECVKLRGGLKFVFGNRESGVLSGLSFYQFGSDVNCDQSEFDRLAETPNYFYG